MINFQDMIAKLTHFWANQGCVVHQGYDLEVGAGTFNPATFLRCLGPEPYSAVYVEPSRRPQDGRYGDNPNRVQFYHQMQVIMKPSPPNIQDLYLQSLEAIGLDLQLHDIRFVHDDWENPTIGAWGLGWEVWSDGMEITQFTYFQAVGGIPVFPVSGEITYGLERLAMYIQGVDSMFDLKWNDEITYGDVFKRSEWEWSHYNFNAANTKMWQQHFEDFEAEAKRLIKEHLPIPAYDFIMKSSHAFNILDARGVISVTERTGYITRIRNLAKMLAESYVLSREKMQFPLMRNHRPRQVISPPQVPAQKRDPQEKQDFLLEIGSEELPATFIPIGVQQLEHAIRAFLKENHLVFEKIDLFGTPRRLAILVSGLAGGSISEQVERKGPTVAAAFEKESGEPSQSGKGFFRSLNLEVAHKSQIEKGEIAGLEIRKIKNIDYLFASFEQQGVCTRTVLAKSLPQMILGLEFPKKMRWTDVEIEYPRPLRWLVSLYGNEVIPFAIGDTLSSNITFGHRQLSPDPVTISHPKEYVNILKKKWVMADICERKTYIEEQLVKIEQHLKGKATAKERVMPQVLHLVEWPFLTVGAFNKSFLHAPKEVLISEMVEHQKYFPIVNFDGDLVPHFVIVCNIKPSDLIRAGNQKALSPRLADGMFLYEEDLKVPLDEFNEKLKSVTFQKELGSVWEKVQRITSIVEILHGYLPICDLNLAVRAATLCKADLASELVGEFPELQGIVGKLYALKHGENTQVASAIDEHWMPRGEKAPLPQTPCGILVSLAEKIDNFLCCFSLDLKPTSSSDPYALRRQAIGLLKMLIEGNYHLNIQKAFKDSLKVLLSTPSLSEGLSKSIQEREGIILEDILNYLTSRLRTILGEYDFEKDEIEAVLTYKIEDVYDLYRKVDGLHAFRQTSHAAFLATLEIYTRTKKILFSQNPQLVPGWVVHQFRKAPTSQNRFPEVNPSNFKDETEKNLFQKVQAVKLSFHTDLIDRREPKGRHWGRAFVLLSELKGPLNMLFDKVKIIDDDVSIKTNRLALLQEVWDLCEELVDFSKIQEHSQFE